jgi:hypothetical protein
LRKRGGASRAKIEQNFMSAPQKVPPRRYFVIYRLKAKERKQDF